MVELFTHTYIYKCVDDTGISIGKPGMHGRSSTRVVNSPLLKIVDYSLIINLVSCTPTQFVTAACKYTLTCTISVLLR